MVERDDYHRPVRPRRGGEGLPVGDHMGPNLIFDKSFLQCLNPDEAVWLDQFFTSVITPLYLVETLADLEKQHTKGRTPEQVVGNLAYKTSDVNVVPNSHHRTILLGELAGVGTVDMQSGRPPRLGGRDVPPLVR